MDGENLSRRTVLGGLGAAAVPLIAGCTPVPDGPVPPASAAYGGTGAASTAAPASLPFRATFLEHMGTVVPDVTAATVFHSRLFNPAIMTENAPPLRLYVDLKPGYLAFGSRANEPRAFFDHFCVLLDDWDRDAVAAALEADGFAPNPAFMLVQDPDGIGVQYYSHPGGWFPTVIPADPLVDGPSLVEPRGLAHVMLNVADMDAALAYYRRYFGMLDERDDADVAWFVFPDNEQPTRLGLRAAPDGVPPSIDHIGVRVAPFDHAGLAEALVAMGAGVAPAAGSAGERLAFTDPMGLKLELVAV